MSRAFRKVIHWSGCSAYAPRQHDVAKVWFSRRKRRHSFYWPHQGERERARRVRQTLHAEAKAAVQRKVLAMEPVSHEEVVETRAKLPPSYRLAVDCDYWTVG